MNLLICALASAVFAATSPSPAAETPAPPAHAQAIPALPIWLAELQPHLIAAPGVATALDPRKLTALCFMDKRRGYVPDTKSLLQFRDQHPDDLQVIYVSCDLQGEELVTFLTDHQLRVPAVSHGSPGYHLARALAEYRDTPTRLQILDRDGQIITTYAWELLKDPSFQVSGYEDGIDAASLAQWQRIIANDRRPRIIPYDEYYAALKQRAGAIAAWPIIEAVLAPHPTPPVRGHIEPFRTFGKAASTEGRWKDLRDLMRFASDLEEDINPQDQIRKIHCSIRTLAHLPYDAAHEAGRAANDGKALLAAVQTWSEPTRTSVTTKAGLHALAAYLVRKPEEPMSTFFWRDMIANDQIVANFDLTDLLSPLLMADDRNAYAYVRIMGENLALNTDWESRVERISRLLSAPVHAARPQALALRQELITRWPHIASHLPALPSERID